MDIQVKGLDSLIRKLAFLGGNADTAIDRGLAVGAQRVKSTAKQICPVDTGRLKGSIESHKSAKNAYSVGTNVEYAGYVEFGTGQRGDPKVDHTTSVKGMSPRPYLYPALEQNKDAVGKDVQTQIIAAIKQRMV